MPSPKQTRNRRPKPPTSFNGMTLEQWQSDMQRVEWAQRDSIFRDILAVATNERHRSHVTDEPLSENRKLGRLEGFEIALGVLHELAKGLPTAPPSPLEPDYRGEHNTAEVYD